MNDLEKQLVEAAKEDWRQTKEEERPQKTFIYAYVANHVSVKTYEKLEMLWGAAKVVALALGIPLLLAFLKYILGF